MHWSCALLRGARPGTRLGDEIFADFGMSAADGPRAGWHRFSGQRDHAKPRRACSPSFPQEKSNVLWSGYLRMHRKYKILWFELDLHHRQRYFSICGCKRTVMMFGVKYAATSPSTEENSR